MAALVAVGLVAGPVGCQRPAAPDGPRPLFAYLPTEPASLNFVAENDGPTRWIGKMICEALVAFDRDLELVPLLASSWESSPDGRVVTFHLRRDVTWHDGTPFTAADVVFTLDRVLDPAALAVGKRVYFDTVTSYEALDDHTLRVERSESYARAVEVWETLPILPRHAYEGQDFLTAPVNRHPVGTGPYRFVAWEAGSRIELERNPDYHGTPAGIERIVFRPLADPSTRVAALLAGELDLTSLRPLDRDRIVSSETLAARVRVFAQETLYVRYIAWNMDGSNSFFTETRVRQAMTHALDRQGFARQILNGAGTVATSLVHPSMWAFDPDLEPWPYDRDRAAELLTASGWIDRDGDGLRDRDGVPFTFTLIVPSGNQEIEKLAALFQESLRTLGVEMKIRQMEFNVFRRLRGDRDWEAYISGWRIDPDPDCYDFWHSSQFGGDGLNYAGYSDPEVDQLCEEGRRLLDRVERAAVYRQVQQLLHRDQPNTFVVYQGTWVGTSLRLAGAETCPLGMWACWPGPRLWTLDGDGAVVASEARPD